MQTSVPRPEYPRPQFVREPWVNLNGTWTYTWQAGRQLASMAKTGTTASFLYNADGLRVRKTVNSVATYYTLHGKNIVHLTQGSNNLHFFYDASGKPSHVNFNGTVYLYVHSLQGDVIAICDAAGNNVVTYSYNAWGKPLSKAGSLAATLGTLNLADVALRLQAPGIDIAPARLALYQNLRRARDSAARF